MKRMKIASGYATALFQFALEQNQLERVAEDMAMVNNLFIQSREFRKVLESPVIKNSLKTKVIKSVLKEHVTEITLRFFTLLISKNRESFLKEICSSFVALYQKHKGIVTVDITTAYSLDDECKEIVIAKLKDLLNARINLEERINKKIIGGLILSFNHFRFDGSIKNMLNEMEREFKENIYEKKVG
ncbi:MAG: ATP synthase F1 subunit delta [Bacteroidales bacterium]|nr:ATP synthase F1 subunit delta [Bacteroidales bacterium]